jgi:hypothetical protein
MVWVSRLEFWSYNAGLTGGGSSQCTTGYFGRATARGTRATMPSLSSRIYGSVFGGQMNRHLNEAQSQESFLSVTSAVRHPCKVQPPSKVKDSRGIGPSLSHLQRLFLSVRQPALVDGRGLYDKEDAKVPANEDTILNIHGQMGLLSWCAIGRLSHAGGHTSSTVSGKTSFLASHP